MQQTALPLSWQANYGIADYIVDDCNSAAFDAVIAPSGWNYPVQILRGESHSGKTHLAHIFNYHHNAVTLNDDADILQFLNDPTDYALIDNADIKLQSLAMTDHSVFHLVNDVLQRQTRLLLTATLPSGLWSSLPDLTSRLAVSPNIIIGQPDDTVVKATLHKLFHDRGLIVEEKVLDFLTIRVERSFAAIITVVDHLDRLALENVRKVTVPLVLSTGLFN